MAVSERLPSSRLTCIDAYRGLVMFLMLAEVLHLSAVARAQPDSALWKFLAHHQEHAEWIGCSLHDLIQPSFSFLVGVALLFSLASRAAQGQSMGRQFVHALWRALVLVFLGVFLRSIRQPRTNYTFEDTLSQIGLGYTFLFIVGLLSRRAQASALIVILLGYWAAFALYNPPSSHDPTQVGVPANWPHRLSGFAAHWDKNSNLAWAFDTWFLNLLPRARTFTHNGGGYATLSFIPTLGTMVLGLLAGNVLRDTRAASAKLRWLIIGGLTLLLAGWTLGTLGICPVVKRIWTPSWVLFSGGWCFLLMAAFYATTDAAGTRGWVFPLTVIGANSIAAYLMSWLFRGFVSDALTRHLGNEPFLVLGPAYETLLRGAAVLAVLWLLLFWMYRRGIFLRI